MASVSEIAANARNAIVRFFRRLIGYASGPGHRNNDPNERLDELERWSARATLWILFGILAEIVLIWVPLPNIWQKVGETSANALIGIGLIVEYFVIGRAIIATGKAKQLSDQQVAEANARAEEANQKAQEAALELARLTTPRVISEEQKQAIIEAISPFTGTPFILLMQPEPEPMALMEQVSDLLVVAGWDWLSSPQMIAFMRPGKPNVGMITGIGIRIQLDSSKKADWEQPTLTLANALAVAGLEDVAAQESDDGSVPPTAIHVRIGRKP